MKTRTFSKIDNMSSKNERFSTFSFHFLFFWLGAFFILLSPFWIGQADAGQAKDPSKKIVIAAIVDDKFHTIAMDILHLAYQRIGYTALFIEMPGKRCLEYANSGKVDGDAARVKGICQIYQNLLPVKMPILYFQGVAFTKGIRPSIRNWNDLKGLRIGVVSGIQHYQEGIKDMNLFLADNQNHLFKLLSLDRIQVAISDKTSGLLEIDKNFKDAGLHTVNPPMYASYLFHVVHKKNRKLIAPLEKVLYRMERSGEIQQIEKNILKQLATQNK
ncbi:MAG: amino acid ABC transporter substrate-binding protein [Desulfobacteraceae bacterium]|nr:amino acid ABC transporter substrate-binding protein [Desulfobacteraceae bacterium]